MIDASSITRERASYLLQRALTPKPKPVERGRLLGELQLQGSEVGTMIPEIVGGHCGGDANLCGVRVAGNIIWTSGVRKHEKRPPGGSGKGGPKQPDTIEITYDIDLAIVFGRGRLHFLKIWAGQDLIYDETSRTTWLVDGEVGPIDPYDTYAPPSPYAVDDYPIDRYGARVDYDADGFGTGTLQKAGYASTRARRRNSSIRERAATSA